VGTLSTLREIEKGRDTGGKKKRNQAPADRGNSTGHKGSDVIFAGEKGGDTRRLREKPPIGKRGRESWPSGGKKRDTEKGVGDEKGGGSVEITE